MRLNILAGALTESIYPRKRVRKKKDGREYSFQCWQMFPHLLLGLIPQPPHLPWQRSKSLPWGSGWGLQHSFRALSILRVSVKEIERIPEYSGLPRDGGDPAIFSLTAGNELCIIGPLLTLQAHLPNTHPLFTPTILTTVRFFLPALIPDLRRRWDTLWYRQVMSSFRAEGWLNVVPDIDEVLDTLTLQKQRNRCE